MAAALVPMLETPVGVTGFIGTDAEREALLADMDKAGIESGTPEELLAAETTQLVGDAAAQRRRVVRASSGVVVEDGTPRR